MKRKKILCLCITAMLTLGVIGCGKQSSNNSVKDTPVRETQETEVSVKQEESAASETKETVADSSGSETGGSHILIAYFSVPEDVSTTDAVASASIVVRDNEKLGNTEYVANVIQQTVGGDLFRIETVEAYPLDHDPLVDQAADEQDEDKRPTLLNHVENLEQYDTILLGYPNWWADLPMPVYTFLEEYDFGTKTIIPFVTHGGSGFSGTLGTISELQPNAKVSENTLSLSRNNVADSEADVVEWAESLGLED